MSVDASANPFAPPEAPIDPELVLAPPPSAAPEFVAVPKALPVASAERVAAVDVLRGFALLGILAMNIVSFSWPEAVYGNPLLGGGFTGLDRAVWWFNHMAFEMKMMTLFSMLFGAGLVLMGERAEKRGARIRGVYYRRVMWLMVIGAVHGYLIWSGDILFWYGACGLLLYLFRNKRPKTLIVLGVVTVSVLVPVLVAVNLGVGHMKAVAARAEVARTEGRTLTGHETRMSELWKSVGPEFTPDPEKRDKKLREELTTYRGGYPGIVRQRAGELIFFQTIGLLLGGLWMCGGRMLLGMGLMKLGVFAGSRSNRFYALLALVGYGVGLPLVFYDGVAAIRHRFEGTYLLFEYGILYNYYGSVLVALGHVGAILLIFKAGLLTWLTDRLAAVGRMALTNYLTHSVVCTTIFYGYGLGYFGHVNRAGLALIVAAIWAAQLLYSPVWLRHFRYGPAEWLWRSLTYWKFQPLRYPPAEAPVMVASS